MEARMVRTIGAVTATSASWKVMTWAWTHNTRPDLYESVLQVGDRPVSHGLGQFNVSQESGEVIRQSVDLEPNFIVTMTLAGELRPAQGVFALLDMLLTGATLIVKLGDTLWLHHHVSHNEAHAWEQITRMPFDLCNHPAWFIPALRLVFKVLVEAFNLRQRWTPDRAREAVRYPVFQRTVFLQANGIGISCLLQS